MASISGSGPTVLRILLGGELRRRREVAGIAPREAARFIRGSESKISRMERGRHSFKEIDVAGLLTAYGVTDESVFEQLMTMARRANQPGWWHSYNDLLPSWFQDYVGMEEAAARIRCYEPQYIPGLVQTEEYTAAVMALGGVPDEEIERRVQLRRARQHRFHSSGLRLWVVLDEAALRRPFGGPEVMRDQLEYLLDIAKLPALTLQVTPFSAGGHAAPGRFSILRFGDAQLPDIVYVEQLTNALYLDKREEVDSYTLAMERLTLLSMPPEESVEMISAILEELS